ncbi:hypothetical protein T265_03951 [Opisthorchis viverrini]|uniref:Uncharacterized protein n=1 Tax=Opisthorchis viverrini TaxID=6198 RepID=A0A075AH94_OPIVI|nr:hypothetical protein T265_03951 [Opisthorchis viverrini]KER29489.1 hypothetical protein T265_03951 [Opisthorchis viverrini]
MLPPIQRTRPDPKICLDSAAPDDVHSPITLTQQINQDPGNQRNGSQNDGQNDSDGSQYRPSKTVEAVLADNDADEYEEYYSYEEDHVGAHQESSGKLDKLDVDAKDLPSPAETQNSDRFSFEGPINPQNVDEPCQMTAESLPKCLEQPWPKS